MLHQIRSWKNGKILYALEADSLKNAIEILVSKKADLRWADLRSADLRWVDLRSANLRWADLSSADLRSADLRSADLRWANLRWADLRWADLRWADLRWADLRWANLGTSWIMLLPDLSDAIDLAPMVFDEWKTHGIESAKERFGLYQQPGENRALIMLTPNFSGGYCYILERQEIWWWNWSCPNPETVPVLWRAEG